MDNIIYIIFVQMLVRMKDYR